MIKKIRLLFLTHGTKIYICIGLIILILLVTYSMHSMESFYQRLILSQFPLQILLSAMSSVIFVFMYLRFLHGGFSKVKKKMIKSSMVNVRWSDVIGIDEAKEEAWEVVEMLKDRTKIKSSGIKPVNAVLFVGPPGCGKTYLAKAIATESKIPFISMAGSEFVEVFVGVGAARIRSVFRQARQISKIYGACILFIDEIDAIGRTRTFTAFGGQETNTTQNQLLVEMDGLNERDEFVFIIGATNADESTLDHALLRPGRFDRKIYIDKPDLAGRQKLFEHYLRNLNYDSSISLSQIAKRTVGKTPAEIENITKEAYLIALRNKREKITLKDLISAIERVDIGIKHKKKMTDIEKEMVAYHEAGHVVAMYFLHPIEDVFKASIIPHRSALGITYSVPREEIYTSNKERILANVKVSLAGYVMEKNKYGTTSDGVASDFQKATTDVFKMVWKYGMNDLGLIGDYTVIPQWALSEEIKMNLNKNVDNILKECMKDVENLLIKNRNVVDAIARELIKKEELEYDEIENIIKETTTAAV